MTLNLTLYRRWFNQIAAGIKRIEYREIKPYWTQRIENKQYSEIHFRNGYGKHRPFMRVEYLGYTIHGKYYCLMLGDVLEITNH